MKFATFRSFCSQPVTKKVSCRVKNGTETYTKMVPRLCKRNWSSTPGGNPAPVNCGTEPRYILLDCSPIPALRRTGLISQMDSTESRFAPSSLLPTNPSLRCNIVAVPDFSDPIVIWVIIDSSSVHFHWF